MKRLDELSVFFPFWNEEANVLEVVNRALPVVKKISEKWEILLIDDGSTDKTKEICRKIAKENPNIKAISYSPNRGYGGALKEGFENSKYKYIAFTDGDRQFDFSEITKFVDKLDQNDIVIGYRQKRRDNLVRHILMNMLRIWDLLFFNFHFKDIDCGFKLFKKSAIEKIYPLRSEGAMITTEILAKAKGNRLAIAEVPVSHFPREFGEQNGANISVIVRAVLESFILWWDMKNGRF